MSTFAFSVVVPVAGVVAFACVLVARPGIRFLALRHATRRPAQAALVIAGVAIATTIVTGAVTAGDSLRASIRRGATSQLGPVDEEIVSGDAHIAGAISAALDRARPAGVRATVPLVALTATVRGRDFVTRVAQAQVLEVDFATAAVRLGAGPAVTGLDGPTPSGDSAAIGADLASAISMAPGHRVTVYAYGTSRTFRISRVLARRGLAGLAPVTAGTGTLSLNLFVPPGTLASMRSTGAAASGSVAPAAAPTSVGAVSNTDPGNRSASDAVTAQLRAVAAGVSGGAAGNTAGVEVRPVKQQLLDDANREGRRFTDLLAAFGALGALAGLLLLALTFSIVVRERTRAAAILRAQGVAPATLLGALAIEGGMYATLGAAVGVAAGIGTGALVVVLGRTTFAGPGAGHVDLTFGLRGVHLAAAGLGAWSAAMVVVLASAAASSRRSVVATMRGGRNPAVPKRRVVTGAGVAALVAGGAITATGLVTSEPAASVAGPAVAMAGLAAAFDSPERRRLVVSAAAVAACAWAVAVVTVAPGAFTRVEAGFVVTEGIVLTVGAIAVATANRRDSGPERDRPRGGRRHAPAVTIGLAYARRDRAGVVLLFATYSVVIFTFTLLATFVQLYRDDAATVATRLGGGAAFEVTSNPVDPVPVADVARLDGVAHVTAASEITARLAGKATGATPDVAVVGFGDDFAGHGAPLLAGGSGPPAATFAAVARDPSLVIVGRDLLADPRSGFAGPGLDPGATLQLRDAASGRSATVTVAAFAQAARYEGIDHVYVARSLVDRLAGRTAASNLLFVETTPGTHNEVLAAVVDGTHLANGAYARSFDTLARATLASQQRFLGLVGAYAAVGLVAMLAGIAVVMVDRVRGRARELAVMRALGFGARTIRRSVRVETAALAAGGTIFGAAAGLLLAWRVVTNGRATQHLPFRLPAASVLVILVAVVLVSLASAGTAARRAGRNRPASGLRAAA